LSGRYRSRHSCCCHHSIDLSNVGV
jgi:hypothetical protein